MPIDIERDKPIDKAMKAAPSAEPPLRRSPRPSAKRDLTIILLMGVVVVPLAWAFENLAHAPGAAPWLVIVSAALAVASRLVWLSPPKR